MYGLLRPHLDIVRRLTSCFQGEPGGTAPPPEFPQQPAPVYGDPRAMQGYYGSPPPQQYGSPAPNYGPGLYGPPQAGPYQQQPMMYYGPPPGGYYDNGYGGNRGMGAGDGMFAACAGILAACCCLDMCCLF